MVISDMFRCFALSYNDAFLCLSLFFLSYTHDTHTTHTRTQAPSAMTKPPQRKRKRKRHAGMSSNSKILYPNTRQTHKHKPETKPKTATKSKQTKTKPKSASEPPKKKRYRKRVRKNMVKPGKLSREECHQLTAHQCVMAKDYTGEWLLASIVSKTSSKTYVKVHFIDWGKEYDEWIRIKDGSSRIHLLTTRKKNPNSTKQHRASNGKFSTKKKSSTANHSSTAKHSAPISEGSVKVNCVCIAVCGC